MQERILQLNREIEELIAFKESFAKEQIPFIIDDASNIVISKDLLVTDGIVTSTFTPDIFIEVLFKNRVYWLHGKVV